MKAFFVQNIFVFFCVMQCGKLLGQKFTIPYKLNQREARLIVLPVAFYDPRTTFAFGLMSATNFYLHSKTMRSSSLQFYSLYTLREQWLNKLKHFFYLGKDDRMILKGEVYYQDFEEDTYGLGSSTTESSLYVIGYKYAGFSEHFLHLVGGHKSDFYIGLSYGFEDYWSFDPHSSKPKIPNEQLENLSTLHQRRSLLGVGFILDKRDRHNAPQQGSYIEVFLKNDQPLLGATQQTLEWWLDVRHYIPLTTHHTNTNTLALRCVTHYAWGDVPYVSLPRVGEQNTSRGFKEGRYRGNYFTTIEAEYRISLFPRHSFWLLRGLQMNIFSSLNWIGEKSASSPFDTPPLPTFGIGFRYVFDSKTGLSIRGDAALGAQNNKAIYLNLNESF